jgi:mevalonate kinase
MDVGSTTFSAPGKVILFGEHSVVYGYPAVASAIGLRAKCSISTSSGQNSIIVPNLIPDAKFFLESKIPSNLKSLEFIMKKILKEVEIQKNFEAEILSDLPKSSGLGSSAAVAVSLAASLSNFQGLKYNTKEISEVAYESEKMIHGTPSGIDNTISTFGGSIRFEKGKIKQIPINLASFHFIIVNSLVQRDTKSQVYAVQERYNKNPNQISEVFEDIGVIVEDSIKCLKNGDLERVGYFMNENQILLDKLGVGHKQIEKIIKILKEQKTIGCKLTGAGGGGCVIGLFDDRKHLNKAIEILQNEGYETFTTEISTQGVRNE